MRNLLMASGLALLLLTGNLPAAEVSPIHEQGVFCDTLDQAKAFLNAWHGNNTTEVLATINTAGTKACGTAELLVVETSTFDTIDNGIGQWLLTEVQVFAQIDETGTHIAPSPVTQYTARKVGEPGTSI